MRVNYSPRTQQELLKIVKYYDYEVPGLGSEFKQELDRQIKLCCESPEIGIQVGKRHRRLVMNRFPYNIIYQIREQEIRVVAVAHQHRKPGYWLPRINDSKINEPAPFWPATFEEVEDAQFQDMLKATPAQRLAMAEELLDLAIMAGAVQKTRDLKLSEDE